MKPVPKVSVIMPVYNGAEYIHEAVESLLAQTFTDIEILIVNDCSTDDTLTVLTPLANSDPRIVIHNREARKGVGAALNYGLTQARAPIVARFDADDFCMPNRLQVQYQFLCDYPNIDVLGSGITIYEENRVIVPQDTHEYIIASMLFCCPIFHPTVMYKKNVIQEAGGYQENSPMEDYELWTTLFLRGGISFFNITEPLIKYRSYPNKPKALFNTIKESRLNIYCRLLSNMGMEVSDFILSSHENIAMAFEINSHAEAIERFHHLTKILEVNKQAKIYSKISLYRIIWQYFIGTNYYQERFFKTLCA